MLEFLWSDWRIGLGAAAALAAVFAVLSAWLTPRGPLTSTEALVSMLAAVLVGLGAGLATGSRWSVVLPVVLVAVFELARIGAVGPTVDGLRLTSTYGWLAFISGRVFHGLLVLVPMMVASRYGVSLAARLGNEGAVRLGVTGWIFATIGTLGVVALAILVARPASTAPIVGADGEPVPGSIAELVAVPVGGHDQVMLIRGRSVEDPVLLHLAGGPGGTDLGAMRADVTLEQSFVVVTWEQRGTGKSYAAYDPAETLTVDQVVADLVEVTNYLRDRFDEDRIYLVGNSWGTFIGVMAVQRHPELYHAFVGTGQMVSFRQTDTMFYEDALAWADSNGNDGLAAILRRNGPPPYDDLLAYEHAIGHEHDWNPYPELDTGKEMPFSTFVPENTLMDRVNAVRGLLDTFSALYPQLQDVDFRSQATSLDVPVYLVTGRYEARGRAEPAAEWFELLQAPSKEMIVFEHSGHRPSFEEPAEFARLMRRVVAETSVAR